AFMPGTTVVISAVRARPGAATALVPTRGFRDVLEIGRANRPDLYNLSYRKPAPFVPRHLRFEVGERMTYQGEVVEPVSGPDLAEVAGRLAGAAGRAGAVWFFHARGHPGDEQQGPGRPSPPLPCGRGVPPHQGSGPGGGGWTRGDPPGVWGVWARG